jgi:putative transcriptional regulator
MCLEDPNPPQFDATVEAFRLSTQVWRSAYSPGSSDDEAASLKTSPDGHPSAELLAAFTSGLLPASADLCLRVHVEGCATCRGAVGALERAEEVLVDELEGVPLAADALDRVLARLDETPVEPAPSRKARRLGDVTLPPALSAYELAPRRLLRPGLWVAHLRMPAPDDWRTYILRAAPGQGLPSHGHSGPELVCVLMGAFRDGREYRAGDFATASRLKRHRLTVTADGPCACLIATRGPLVLRGEARRAGETLAI